MLENNTEQTTNLKTVKNFMAINLAQFSQEKRQQTQVHFYVSFRGVARGGPGVPVTPPW